MKRRPDMEEHMRKYIAERRAQLGLSLQKVADAAGCAKTHIWEIEKGRKPINPTINFALSLCEALQCSLNDLLGFEVSDPKFTDAEIALVTAHRNIFET